MPVLDNAGVNGVYTSSEGVTGAKVWGTRGRWMALAGKVADEDVVLLMVDHPKNPGYPTYWHARGYGLFAANPLGQAVFSDGKETLDFTLAPGAKATFRHLLLVLPGPVLPGARGAGGRELRRSSQRPVALQAGFVGCGNITDTHARAAREAGLGIAAFHGRDLAKAEALAARFGGRAFSRYEDFLAHRPMDLVVIGSPSALHADQGIAAAEHSLHVLVEKPIDVDAREGPARSWPRPSARASGSACCSRTASSPSSCACASSSRRAGSGACCSPRRASSGTARPSTTRPRTGAADGRSTAAPRSSTRASTRSTCCCGCSGT